jgi:hypothetical protein
MNSLLLSNGSFSIYPLWALPYLLSFLSSQVSALLCFFINFTSNKLHFLIFASSELFPDIGASGPLQVQIHYVLHCNGSVAKHGQLPSL